MRARTAGWDSIQVQLSCKAGRASVVNRNPKAGINFNGSQRLVSFSQISRAPRVEVKIAGSPSPTGRRSGDRSRQRSRVADRLRTVGPPRPSWAPTGSRYRSINWIHLEPRGETLAIRHSGEAVYLVAEGELRLISGTVLPVRRWSLAYLPHAVEYRFAARTEMTIFGGPCPPRRAAGR